MRQSLLALIGISAGLLLTIGIRFLATPWSSALASRDYSTTRVLVVGLALLGVVVGWLANAGNISPIVSGAAAATLAVLHGYLPVLGKALPLPSVAGLPGVMGFAALPITFAAVGVLAYGTVMKRRRRPRDAEGPGAKS